MAFSIPTPRDRIRKTDSLRKWIEDIFLDVNDGFGQAEETAANIADSGHSINTIGKYAGKIIYDSTNKRLVRAAGATAGADWEVIDGSVQVTPS